MSTADTHRTQVRVRELYFRLQKRRKSYNDIHEQQKPAEDVHKAILKRMEIDKVLAEMRETFGGLLDA